MFKILSSLVIAFLLLGAGMPPEQAQAQEGKLQGTITISGAWALYPMVVKWAEEFQKIHPQVRIDVGAGGAGKGMADALARIADIGMVSREIYPQEIEKGAWWVSVTRDAVVPTLNANNPLLQDLVACGLNRQALIDIWISAEVRDWKDVVAVTDKTPGKTPLNVYTRSDACGAAKTWAKFLGQNQEDLLGVGVYGDPGLAEAVRKDVLGIGYNNINYVYDVASKEQVPGIRVLPLDLNDNGRIDQDEDFYHDRDAIVQAIAEGKYPAPPARDLHLVSQGLPEKEAVIEFIKWVLTDGQKYVPPSGYINLTAEKLREELSKLD